MIKVTRINGSSVVLNALLIESVEATPDTVITLVTGKKWIVKEPVEELIGLVKQYLIETKASGVWIQSSTEE
jgi:flagellar protein FlbD